ncbi:dentin sialophosphoprotein-like [Anneissia japonica]|uniref:dentin sialophosphoprotein-like n=1 Tax=Anneissia japonica TaxID=1529436 RepID=UPI0014255D3E|nr:dentin sialophosphoprotein-like [Anneissia japonica]
MGKFEVDRFVNAPDPDLVCCVCYCVLDDALESPCQHVYCKVCIYTWLDNRKSCPNCRRRLRSTRLKPVLPIVRNMINRLQIRCENVENGCTHVMQLEAYNSHVEMCDYRFVNCTNNECNEKVLYKNLEEHKHQCLHRLTKCEKGCDLLLPLGKLTGHNCLSELKEKLQKVEGNLQIVTLKMTDVEKRIQVLERHHQRRRSDRSPSFHYQRRRSDRSPSLVSSISSLSRRRSPPLPWYSPSGPNQGRFQNRYNQRSRQSNQSRDQTQNADRPRDRNRSRSPSSSPFISRTYIDLNNRTPRRSRSRSWSLLRSSTSRSVSPIRDGSLISDSSDNQSDSSTWLSSIIQGFNTSSAAVNSSDDESFYSEMNRSFSSGSVTTDLVSGTGSPTQNNERGLLLEEDIEITTAVVGTGDQEDNAFSPTPAANVQQPANDAMNTSNVIEQSVESENQEEMNVVNVRRSSRLAARREDAMKSGTQEMTDRDEGSSSMQHSTSFSAVPILSRITIEELMSEGTESSNESSWRPESDVTTSDFSVFDGEDDENDSCNSSNYFSSCEQEEPHWTSLLQNCNSNSSDTDDTWSLGTA